jgi:hypothetical protein
VGGGTSRINDSQGSFAITWQRRRLVLETLGSIRTSHLCGQQLLAPHLLGKSGEVWGYNANGLDVKV